MLALRLLQSASPQQAPSYHELLPPPALCFRTILPLKDPGGNLPFPQPGRDKTILPVSPLGDSWMSWLHSLTLFPLPPTYPPPIRQLLAEEVSSPGCLINNIGHDPRLLMSEFYANLISGARIRLNPRKLL